MRDEALMSITRILDCAYDPESEGWVGFSVHSDKMDKFLKSPGNRVGLANELEDLAAKCRKRTYPFQETH